MQRLVGMLVLLLRVLSWRLYLMWMLNRDATAEHMAYMSSEEVVSTGVQVEVEDVEAGV